MSTSSQKIGFIGLGKMGSAICSRIRERGFAVAVFNRTSSKAEPLLLAGATRGDSPLAVARHSDVVLTSLFDDASVLETCQGENGILEGLNPGSIHVGLTTILPSTAVKLAGLHEAVGCAYVSAPVLGRPDAAEAGSLRVFASGNQEAIVRCDGIFDAFSHFVLNLGQDPAAACVMKICANYIAATQIELMGEVYAFAEKSGLALDVVMAAFQTAYADPTLKMYAEKIKNRAFDSPGFDVDGGGKDLAIFQKAFADVGVSAGIAGVAMEKFTIARALGLGKKDWSATYEITRLMAGLDSAARPAR